MANSRTFISSQYEEIEMWTKSFKKKEFRLEKEKVKGKSSCIPSTKKVFEKVDSISCETIFSVIIKDSLSCETICEKICK